VSGGASRLRDVDLDPVDVPSRGITVISSGLEIADGFGRHVADAGDVDGDGHADIIVAIDAAPAGVPGAIRGGWLVIFGESGASSIDLAREPSRATFLFSSSEPSTGALAGSGVGDVDGDGFDDIALGFTEIDRENPRASVRLVFGGRWLRDERTIDLASGGVAREAVQVGATASDADLGASIARLGDIDADGLGDFALGAPSASGASEAWILFGRARPWASVELSNDEPSSHRRVRLGLSGGRFGESIVDGFDA